MKKINWNTVLYSSLTLGLIFIFIRWIENYYVTIQFRDNFFVSLLFITISLLLFGCTIVTEILCHKIELIYNKPTISTFVIVSGVLPIAIIFSGYHYTASKPYDLIAFSALYVVVAWIATLHRNHHVYMIAYSLLTIYFGFNTMLSNSMKVSDFIITLKSDVPKFFLSIVASIILYALFKNSSFYHTAMHFDQTANRDLSSRIGR